MEATARGESPCSLVPGSAVFKSGAFPLSKTDCRALGRPRAHAYSTCPDRSYERVYIRLSNQSTNLVCQQSIR